MGCGLLGLIVALLGAPIVLGVFMGARTSIPFDAPLMMMPTATATAIDPALRLVYTVDSAAAYTDDDLAAAVTVLTQRLERLEIAGGQVMLQDDDRIVVLLPPVDDLEGLMAELARPGTLELIALGDSQNGTALLEQTVDTERYPDRGGLRDPITGEPFAVVVSNEAVERAEAIFDPSFGQWQILVTFNAAGAEQMGSYTAANIGEALGIVIDGVLILAPMIQSQLTDQAVISLVQDAAEARRLAARIGGGALPVPLILESVETVGT